MCVRWLMNVESNWVYCIDDDDDSDDNDNNDDDDDACGCLPLLASSIEEKKICAWLLLVNLYTYLAC